jgi:hypothetical protein
MKTPPRVTNAASESCRVISPPARGSIKVGEWAGIGAVDCQRRELDRCGNLGHTSACHTWSGCRPGFQLRDLGPGPTVAQHQAFQRDEAKCARLLALDAGRGPGESAASALCISFRFVMRRRRRRRILIDDDSA